MLAQTVKAMNDQELSELSRDVAREIAQRGGRVSDGALSIAVAALQQIAQLGSEERDRVTARAALDCIDALGETTEPPAPLEVQDEAATNVVEMLPTWPMVRCDDCRSTYRINKGGAALIVGDCPDCGGERFSTSMASPAVREQEA